MSAGKTTRAGRPWKRRLPAKTLGFLALIGTLAAMAGVPGSAAAAECTDTWVGPAESTWQTASNWSTGHVPTSTDVACIGSGKTAKVTSGANEAGVVQGEGSLVIKESSLEISNATEPSSIKSLTMEYKATLTGAATLNVTNAFSWNSLSTMSGTGSTVLKPEVTATMEASTATLIGRTLVNEGTLTYTRSILMSEGAVLENKGTFNANSQELFGIYEAEASLTPATFVNRGTFQKTALTGETRVELKFENFGLINGNSGTILFRGEKAVATLAAGSELEGNISIKGGSSFTGKGFNGEKATVTIREATLSTASETTSTIGKLTMDYKAEITGSGTLEPTNTLSWINQSTMSGSGVTRIPSSATVTITTYYAYLKTRTLVNEGTFNLEGEGTLRESEGATFKNEATINANSVESYGHSPGIVAEAGAPAPSVINHGTIQKSVGTGKTRLNVNVENYGHIIAETGTLFFNQNEATATLKPESTLEGSIAFEKEGIVGNDFTLDSGLLYARESTITLEGTATSVANLEIRYGTTVTGSGDIEITQAFNWAGQSTLSGSGTTVLAAGSSNLLESGATTVTLDQRKLRNQGAFTQTESSYLKLRNGASIVNNGTYSLNSEPYPTWVPKVITTETGSSAKVVNNGTFQRTEGKVGVTVASDFESTGTINQTSSGKVTFEHPITLPASNSFGKHCKGGDPVDCATGDFSESETDFAVGGRGVGLILSRTYSAQGAVAATSAGAFGYGWAGSFSDHLTTEEGSKEITAVAGNGSTETFTEESGGSFTAPAWSQDKLAGSAEAGYTLTKPNQTQYHFASTGKLETVTDRNANQTTLGYDESGRLKTITDPAGRKVTFTYNAGGQIEKAEDPMGHVVKYAYEGGNLTGVTMPGEESPRWQFKYDGSHRMTKIIDGRGGETTNEYDSSSRVVSQTDPAGRTMTFKYEAFHTTVTNKATGAVTNEWFTSNNEPFSITRGYGTAAATTETFTYNEAGRLTGKTDGNEHTRTIGYDSEDNKTSEKDAVGDETTWTYNETHDVVSITTPNGEKTTITRDANGNPETISRPAPGETTQTTTYKYGTHGELESVTDPLEHTWSYEYDSYGDRNAETDPEGDKRTWAYDEDSRLTSTVSPRGNDEGAEASKFTTSIERDAQGRPIKVTDPLEGTTKYAYDANGNLESLTDPNGHKTTFTYDADNEPTKVERPNGNVLKTGYDGAGQVTSQTDGSENTTTYVRNVLEEPVEVIDPLERTTTQEYDAAGNLIAKTDPAKRKTSYAYDAANRLKEISYSDGVTPTAKFGYDKDGNLTSMSDGTGESSFTYDQLDRFTEAKDGHGSVVSYEYNLGNEQTGITYPNGKSVGWSFDKAGQLTSVTDWLKGTTSFTYDRDSNLARITFPEGTGNVDEYAYDRADGMSEAKMKKGIETLAALAYTRDKAGQLESLTSKGLPGAEEESFGYDENNRLTKAGTGNYEYDAANNLTKAPGTENSYDKASELEKATGVTFSYDEEGERTTLTPVEGPATTYNYDQAGRLTAVERAKEGEVPAISESYVYDGLGLRASQTVSGTTSYLTWDRSSGLPSILADGQNSYLYGPEGQPFEQISSEEAPTYLHHDQLGSTRLLTNSSGEATSTFTYKSYGALSGSTGTGTTPFGFAGQYTDFQSGLQYLRARMYDPATGQFLTRDPLEAITRQPYTYSFDNPLNLTDPSGHFAGVAVGCTIGEVVAPEGGCVPGAAVGAAATAAAAVAGAAAGAALGSLSGNQEIAGNLTISKSLSARFAKSNEKEEEEIEAEEGCDITFGHGERHLDGTGLSPEEVESAIEDQVKQRVGDAEINGPFRGTLRVGDREIEYRGYSRNGKIHIGTYYPVD